MRSRGAARSVDDMKRVNGEAIRARRRKAGLTAQALAARVGCHQATVTKLELAQRQPSIQLLAGLATVLDCTVDDLLEDAA